ncbi:hypothetical protein TNIN_432101, partial [Trichonephila inaurata madagascariensis]
KSESHTSAIPDCSLGLYWASPDGAGLALLLLELDHRSP